MADLIKRRGLEVHLIAEAYLALLQLPFNKTRMDLQPTLCTLRDTIADLTQMPAQEVQEFFEKFCATRSMLERLAVVNEELSLVQP
jgi:hypothetical protein